MRMSKAPKEHVDRLRIWLQFTDKLSEIDPENKYEWDKLKKDWSEDEDFSALIKNCENEEGEFDCSYYLNYFRKNISYIHMRILMGYEVLIDNACDPDLDYLDFKPEIKKLMENVKN